MPEKNAESYRLDPLIFKDHDNYYAWRNVQPATGDVMFTEIERELVAAYINRLEKSVSELSRELVPMFKGPWPWETIDRED